MDNSNRTELPVQPEELAQQAWLEERAGRLAARRRVAVLEAQVALLVGLVAGLVAGLVVPLIF